MNNFLIHIILFFCFSCIINGKRFVRQEGELKVSNEIHFHWELIYED